MRKQMGRLVAGATVAAVVAAVASYSQQRTEAAFSAPVNVAVSADVARNCVLTAGSVLFGTYDPLVANDVAPLNQTGTFTVRCVRGVTAQIGLDDGVVGGRQMSDGGSELLDYELYKDAGRTSVWDETGAGRYSYTATSRAAETLTIYGQIPGGQDVAEGSYSDTVVAIAEF